MKPAERSGRVRRGRVAAVLLAGLVALLVSAPVVGQRADFRFGAPHLTLSATTGWAMPGESGDVFGFTREHLTVSRGDFASPFFMVEAALRVTERVDLAVGVDHASSLVRSEMRDWVTQDDGAIAQITEFTRSRVMGSVKAYLFRRGRTISEFSWLPRRWSPYVGAGAGWSRYEFLQEGDFVDFQTADIFRDRFRTAGAGVSHHAMAGMDVSLSPYFLLRGEYRRIWGGADVDETVFSGFGDIDLSGSRATLGLAVRL